MTSEIEKVRKQFRSARSPLKTVQGMASELGGSWLIAHDLEFSSRYLEKVSQTTIDDIHTRLSVFWDERIQRRMLCYLRESI